MTATILQSLDPSFTRDCAVLIITHFALGAACYALAAMRKNERDFWLGHRAGRDEERSRRNAILIRAKLQVFKDGVVVGMARAWKKFGKPKED